MNSLRFTSKFVHLWALFCLLLQCVQGSQQYGSLVQEQFNHRPTVSALDFLLSGILFLPRTLSPQANVPLSSSAHSQQPFFEAVLNKSFTRTTLSEGDLQKLPFIANDPLLSAAFRLKDEFHNVLQPPTKHTVEVPLESTRLRRRRLQNIPPGTRSTRDASTLTDHETNRISNRTPRRPQIHNDYPADPGPANDNDAARSLIISLAKHVAFPALDPAIIASTTTDFVDQFLSPTGLTQEVARMMMTARQAVGNDIEGIEGNRAATDSDFLDGDMGGLLSLLGDLEALIESKIACVALGKAFFKYVLVPLQLAGPVASMILDRKPLLLKAFALKALLLKPELLIQPDLLFRSGLLFKPGLLPGMGDLELKKLLLAAVLAPKVIAGLKPMFGASLGNIPLLLIEKLVTLDPGQLLMLLSSLSGGGLDGLLGAMGTDELKAQGAEAASWESVNSEGEPDITAAGAEEDARSLIIRFAREVGRQEGAEEEYASRAAEFVDQFLSPTGLTQEVARMMMTARQAVGNGIEGIEGNRAATDSDFLDGDMGGLLSLLGDLEALIESKIACVALGKAFFKYVLVPLQLAGPVASMILDKKPLLLKAFALKALLLKPELLIQPDLLFRSGLLFKPGLLPGMGDLELKKLLLAAVLAPKVIAGLKPMFGASLGNIPLLLIEKLVTLDPGQLLMLLSSLSGGGLDGLLGAMGTDELKAQGAEAASWESVNSEGEPDITAAGAEEDARSLIIRFAREVGRQEGAEEEYASRAAEFVDQFLSPTGLTQEVARMMMTARQAVGNDIEGIEGNRAATDSDFLDGDMGGLLSLLGDLEALIESKIACVALGKAFFKYVLVPLQLAGPVASMILDKKPLLLKAFALKALLLKPELLIQPDLLFRSGLLFKPGLLPGMGDSELKKLLLAAVLAPKVIAGLKPMFGASLGNIPLLLIEKLVTLDPGQLLMLLSSLSGGGLDGLLGAMGTDELKAQGAEAASWESVNSEGEPDITAAGAEEDARSLIIRFAREVGRQEGAEEEYASRAAEFVDQFLSPTGLTQEVARMMMTARQAVGNDIEGIEGNRAATDSDFLDGDMGGLLSLLGDLEALIESKIACVALGKAFFKYVLVPLQLAGPVASMILDRKPLLLKAFALKALLLKPELLIQPDLLFRSGLLFKPGLLPGMGDSELKKLLLAAVLAPKVIAGLKPMFGASLGNIPLLLIEKLVTLDPGQLLMLLSSLSGGGLDGLLGAMGTDELKAQGAEAASWESVNSEGEPDITAAGAEEDARSLIIRFAREVGRQEGAEEEYASRAAEFVDQFLSPTGLTQEVARMMMTARQAVGNDIEGIEGNRAATDSDFLDGDMGGLLSLLGDLEALIESKIACVALGKAFFKYVLVPLQLAGPVASMILDRKPLLLKAFALKALLLKPELLIQPDLLFRSGLLFKPGLLPGMGDLELKKLLLAAVLAPKVIAGLKPMFGASLGNIPLLLIEKLVTLDPGQLLMLLSSLSGGGLDGLLGAMGTDELKAQGAEAASWESVNSEGEPDITAAGAEEDARSLIIRFAREVGRQEGAEEEYASRAAEFVDQFLSPTGLTQEVARMMMTARQAVGNDIEGIEGNRAATDSDFLDGDMGGLLSLLGDLEALIESKIACVALGKAFFKYVLVPLQLAGPVASMILDKKPLLLKAFALKALLLKPELLIQPDLLFRSGLLFKPGLLPGMGDSELKKLLLAAVLAPKVIAGLKPMFGASLGNIPLLLIEKLVTLDPGQLLMLLSSLSGGGLDGLLGAMGTDELKAQGAEAASWESVNSEGEPDITAAGAEEDARSLIIRFAREVGRQEGAEEEYASRAAEFVDQFLSPTGLTQEVARMMMTARQAVGNDIEGIEGNRAATDSDFLDGDMGGLLSLLGDLEALIESKIACVALGKAFFKYVLVPLQLAGPVASMILDRKPLLLKAFALKALLLKPELLIQPDLLFRSGLLFKPGLLPGMGDSELKKLLLAAVLAPKVIAGLKPMFGASLGNIPLLLIEKLVTLDPGQLLMLLSSLSGGGLDGLLGAMGTDELKAQGAEAASWESVNSEGEPDITAAGAEEDARSLIIRFAREVGRQEGAEEEYASRAAEFVDQFLSPTGLTQEVARMMMTARQAVGNDIEGIEGNRAATDSDFLDGDMGGLLSLLGDLEALIESKIACVALGKAFFKYVLVPLQLAGPVASMILDRKPLLLKAFALKALLLKPELLIQPDLLFRSGLLFKPGLLPGMGDLELKKLLLAAVLAPKVIAGLKPMFGASLGNIPLLLIEKLVTLDPGQLLMLLSSLSGGGLDGLLGAMGTDELKAQGAEAASWESVNSEGEPDITAAGAEEDARSLIIRFAREVGRQEGAEEEYASRAAEFVDQFLSPTGLTQEVARMMMTARQAVGNDIEGIDGNRAATDSDFLDGDMGGLLSLLGDLEALIESKIACVALGKAFFKYVLVPLQLAGPVASMILDRKPLLLKAFALKALLLKPELLIQPDLLFRSGLLFKPGLLPGMGDLELKKLLLAAVLAPKVIAGLKPMFGASLGNIPLLLIEKLVTLDPGQLLMLLSSLSGGGLDGLLGAMGTDELKAQGAEAASWESVNSEGEPDITAAGAEEDARSLIIRFAREVGRQEGAEEEYASRAAEFVDQFLSPTGLTQEVARMMMTARQAVGNDIEGIEGNRAATDSDFLDGDMGGLLSLLGDLEALIESKIACVALGKAFFKYVLVPLQLAGPVASMILDKKPLLLKAFALKALLLKPELLIQPDLLFRSGLLFKPGLLPGMGDLELKKLLLAAVLAPKVIAGLKPMFGASLGNIPLLLIEKLVTLDPGQLLMLLSSLSGGGLDGLLGAMGTDELKAQGAEAASWESVNSEGEPDITAAGAEEDARSLIIRFAREVGRQEGAEEEYASRAAEFVDQFLSPTGLTQEVARMMMTARQAVGNDIEGIEGNRAATDSDFLDGDMGGLLSLLGDLEALIESKIACVALGKAFFKYVLVPLQLAGPVASMILDKKPLLLKAFALKALLLKPELLIQPDLLFRSGLLFKPGLLPGMGDLELKKLLLAAVLAPKVIAGLKPMFGASLGNIPLLLIEKLVTLDPGQLLMLLSSLSGGGLDGLLGAMGTDELKAQGAEAASWESVNSEGEPDITAAGAEEDARSLIIRFAREVGRQEGAEEEYASRAAEFVDQFLSPTGLTQEVARMMMTARQAVGNDIEGIEGNRAATDSDFLDGDMGGLLSLLGDLEALIESKIACVALGKAFFKYVLVPLQLAGPVASMILDKKPLLLKAFALKALLLKPELLIQPDLLFRSGLLFKPGLLPGMGDLELKKLVLDAVLVCILVDGVTMVGNSRGMSQFVRRVPGLTVFELLALLASDRRALGAIVSLCANSVGIQGSGPQQLLGTYEERLHALKSAAKNAGQHLSEEEAEARFQIVRFAGEVGSFRGAPEEYVRIASAFVDRFLAPAGLLNEVAQLIRQARKETPESDAVASNKTSFDQKLFVGGTIVS